MPDVTIAANAVSSGEVALVAATVSTITFTENIGSVCVANPDAGATVWFTTDGSTPTVGGKNALPVFAGSAQENIPTVNSGGGDVVKLISSGTPNVYVYRGQ